MEEPNQSSHERNHAWHARNYFLEYHRAHMKSNRNSRGQEKNNLHN